jgi:hypothetical protein
MAFHHAHSPDQFVQTHAICHSNCSSLKIIVACRVCQLGLFTGNGSRPTKALPPVYEHSPFPTPNSFLWCL